MSTSVKPPVRHLWILRHGKAASDAPWGGGDRERPLTARGRRDATALGKRLGGEVPIFGMDGVPAPDLAVCSDAVRTRQTAELLIEATGRPLPLDSYRSLYGADTDLVLRYLREIDEGVTGALVVGHNPPMHHLIWELVGGDGVGDCGAAGGAPGGRAVLEAQGFPTCALAVLAIGVGGWEDLALGGCTLVGLFKPPY